MTTPADPDAYQFHRVPDIPANRYQGHLLVSDQVTPRDIALVCRELEHSLQQDVPGAIVEFGCYAGTTSLFIRRLLDRHDPTRAFHVYDSFEGLPAKSTADNNAAGTDFQAGKLRVSKKTFLQIFQAAGLHPPVIHKGWFNELPPEAIPESIAFGFLDGDFYDSILTSLQLVWPRLSPGGTVLIDDYGRPDLPGVKRAVDDFFHHRTPPALRVEHTIALLKQAAP